MSKAIFQSTVLLAVAFTVVSMLGVQSASAAGKPLVKYRLTVKKTIHLGDRAAAEGCEKSLKNLGCDVQLHAHGGHFDLTYHCPQWRQAEFDSEAAAHKWQNWLKSLGFETAHQHQH